MNLIDEDDDVRVVLQLLEQGSDALLKLSTVFRACHYGSHVETYHAAIEEHRRCLMTGDELCQAFDNSTLAHTRFTDKDGVVLLSASENLDDALNLFLPANNGVELALGSRTCEVGREVVEHRCLTVALRLCGCCLPAIASLLGSAHRTILLKVFFLFIGQSNAILGSRFTKHLEGCLVVEIVHL